LQLAATIESKEIIAPPATVLPLATKALAFGTVRMVVLYSVHSFAIVPAASAM
jgi:hypothetical protein